MNNYAVFYRREIQELNSPLYKKYLRIFLTLAAFMDRHPRTSSALLFALALYGIYHIFMYYPL